MRRLSVLVLLICTCLLAEAQPIQRLYLLPGQGSDLRIFSNLQFPDSLDTIQLKYIDPLPEETMEAYAARMAEQIDTTVPFALMGVSLGGMLSMEMSDIVHPEKVILLSSASSSEEIPPLYHYFQKHPVYQHIPPGIIKYSTFVLQPVYEPDRKEERAICNSMIYNKDAAFMHAAVHMIVNWQRTEADNIHTPVYQIHGLIDQTLPVENIRADTYIDAGSHMMTLTQADVLSPIINAALGY